MRQPQGRIYCDNAATSWPKPPEVVLEIARYYRENGAAAGRGTSHSVGESDRLLANVRRQISLLIGAEHSDEVTFGFNGTDVLNAALHGFLRAESHVVTTAIEHNSVLRPLHFLNQEKAIRNTVVPCDSRGVVSAQDIADAIEDQTALVCVSHASNVCGAIQPIDAIGDVCRERGVSLMIDAAQTVGHHEIDVISMQCDLLASSGHKGLLGPLGTGFLFVSRDIADKIRPFRQGGTGSQSDLAQQPEKMPWKMESGNLNMGAIAGLGASLAFLDATTIEKIRQRETEFTDRLWEGLKRVPNVVLYGPEASEQRVGVVSFNIGEVDCREVAAVLEASFGIEVRAGFHCSPLIHQYLGSLVNHGTVRVSPGFFNTTGEIDTIVDAVSQIAESMV